MKLLRSEQSLNALYSGTWYYLYKKHIRQIALAKRFRNAGILTNLANFIMNKTF